MTQATGRLGASVNFDGTTVTIHRKPFRGSLVGTGDQTIPISQLAAVEFKPAGAITREGFIRFVVAGAAANQARTGQQNNAARTDPWAVMFWRKEQPAFEQLRDAIQSALARHHGHPLSTEPHSVADELAKLVDLHVRGHLTDAEFANQKLKLLKG